MSGNSSNRLRRELGLFDVYAISTGAMFSSGFFLLPGIAAAATGPSVPLTYLVAGIFIVPAMLSVAELATAMPRAGGAYYFLDRSMGPLVGTVGGLGTWMALILKTAFALVGMGAYLNFYLDVPVEPLALALTAIFMVVNIAGAKETSGLQRLLVTVLLVVLAGFLLAGFGEVATSRGSQVLRDRFSPLFSAGAAGFVGTVGLVFVSYAGLTKVASVAEEVRNPDRNIPLGMTLSLVTASFVYTVGVALIVALLPSETLHNDLTPVASAAASIDVTGLPTGVAVALIVTAAVAAFASTGNAGILAASRYPLAMGRDRLVSERFSRLGRFRTPTLSVAVTSLLIAACIAFLDVSSIAKLASAFQLLLFSLLNLGVVIMRESGIAAYDPGYRSPFYPWMQLFGFLAPFWLIAEMGQLAILFTLGLITLTVAWYFVYARGRVARAGAILHTFARMGAGAHAGLDRELRAIVREKGLRTEDPYNELVARAPVLDVEGRLPVAAVTRAAAQRLAPRTRVPAPMLEEAFLGFLTSREVPVAHGAAFPHVRLDDLDEPALLVVRCREGVEADVGSDPDLHALFFLVTRLGEPTLHLRILGHLAARIDEPDFLDQWLAAEDDAALKSLLLEEEEHVIELVAGSSPGTDAWIGLELREARLPEGCLIAAIHRNRRLIVPSGGTSIQREDRLTIIGESAAIERLRESAR